MDVISVRRSDDLLLFSITSPILWLVAVFTTAVENHHDVSALNLAENSSHVLERVVGLCGIVEYNLSDVVQHAAMACIIDDEKCFDLSLFVGDQLDSVVIHQ